jgi:indolepyruvate ferredoxin oxidoreductase
MATHVTSLDDKYTVEKGRVFLTGVQALVRLAIVQHDRDAAAGLKTAGFIAGYRGSPLGGYDQQLARARKFLEPRHIKVWNAVNEELAATACWGTQQGELSGEAKFDGVCAIWYGKGPGVDRAGDGLKHGNLAGSSKHGGVLVLMGDDHTCESSTTSHQSEYAMVDAQIPVLNPAGVQEILDYGLYGWAMSRFTGGWVGIKCVHDNVNIAASVEVDPARVQIRIPADFAMPEGGLNIRRPDTPQEQEARLHRCKVDAARAFCRANGLDRIVLNSRRAWLGIATTGKSFLDVRQALDDLGIDAAVAERLGVRLYKLAMPWPLEPEGARKFASGLSKVVVVEEKRGLIEPQLKEALYGFALAPAVVGKRDEKGGVLFPSEGKLDSNQIAIALGRRILERADDAGVRARLAELEARAAHALPEAGIERLPYFCPGCPHNTSTRVPEGSRALAGIGCHYMAQWMDRDTTSYTQMGAEGAGWIGEAPFSKRGHVFQNIGDGTYFHSGVLAIRAAVAAGVNVTYKILYNDAVAMTGGQGMDGPLTVARLTRQLQAEGVVRIVVVSEEPRRYRRRSGLARGVAVRHRDLLDTVQREIRDVRGVSAIVYDQTCAAEKRRRRKQGQYPDPPKRVFINDLVCEGCGDCGVKSNCVAVVPLETEFGRKRAIDQSACNKDYSCLKGFCPSFVTVEGGRLRRGYADPGARETIGPALTQPTLPSLDQAYGIVVTGIGGTGVVTIGALLGMAAHLEGKGCGILDMTGLAQKGGAVISHIRIGARPEDVAAPRIAAGGADLMLAGDIVVAAGAEGLSTVRSGRTRVVLNTNEAMTGDFTRQPDLSFPGRRLRQLIENAAGHDRVDAVDATRLATALIGDSIATNLFMVGYAWQKGLIPLAAESIERAIELNGASVELNKRAFAWGRHAAVDAARVERLTAPAMPEHDSRRLSGAPEEAIERRARFLAKYQSRRYARRYRRLVEAVRKAEAEKTPGMSGLADAVARSAFKLMAYKDEYEVARLYADRDFRRKLAEQFEGSYRLKVHLAPPILGSDRGARGEPHKRAFGRWVLVLFRLLAAFRFLRGTPLDIFGYLPDRREERRLIRDYQALVPRLLADLNHDRHALAVEIAQLPEQIRGYGHIKRASAVKAKAREAALLQAFQTQTAQRAAAE